MFNCPGCKAGLRKINRKQGVFWVCPSCDGRVTSMGIIRRVCPPDMVNLLWQKARSGEYIEKRNCPICQQKMREVSLDNKENALLLDVCIKCHFVWFDPKEYESLPKTQTISSEMDRLPPKAREQLAIATLEASKDRQRAKEMWSTSPDHWWEVALAFFGFPVEYNDSIIENKPIVTWVLAGIIILISMFAFSNLESAIMNWGLIPEKLGRYFGLTFVSSFFLHAGWVHLIGNLYFLFVFGDNTEDILGRGRYLLLIALAALVGAFAHILGDPRPTMPCVGASAGISGIIAYYCLRFRRASIGILVLWHRWARIPAIFMFGFWIMLQLILASMQTSGYSNISGLAHLGGVSVGILFWWLTRKE